MACLALTGSCGCSCPHAGLLTAVEGVPEPAEATALAPGRAGFLILAAAGGGGGRGGCAGAERKAEDSLAAAPAVIPMGRLLLCRGSGCLAGGGLARL